MRKILGRSDSALAGLGDYVIVIWRLVPSCRASNPQPGESEKTPKTQIKPQISGICCGGIDLGFFAWASVYTGIFPYAIPH